MFGIATIAISVPQSNMGRLLRAEVETPPSLGIAIPTADEEEPAEEEETGDEAPSIPGFGEDDEADVPCTDGELQENDSEICEEGEFILCDDDSEGEEADDGDKTCEDGEWIDTEDEEPPEEEESDLIKITRHEADPDYFNPTIEDTEIEYTLSKDAVLEIVINNASDQEQIKLLDDEEVDEGEGEVVWNGTDDNDEKGTVLPAGLYKYKIKAKNTDTEATEDTEEGYITLAYTEVTQSTSTTPESESSTDSSTDSTESTDSSASSDDNSEAVQAMTNTTTGETSDTGPGVLIYAAFPLMGILLTKRKRKR